MAAADGDDPRRLAAEFELTQRQLAQAERRLQALQEALVETRQAAATLRALAESAGPRDAFVPVGAGVHVRAAIDPAAAVLRPLGAGYATEGNLAEAQAGLEAQAEALQRSFQEASAAADRLAATAGAINDRLAELSDGGNNADMV